MTNLNKLRSDFEAIYWNPTAVDWFSFNEKLNRYIDLDPHTGNFPHESEELIHQLNQLNNAWDLYQKPKHKQCQMKSSMKFNLGLLLNHSL